VRARPPHIGLYVHDVGRTSRSRAAALLQHLDVDVTLLSALPADDLPHGSETPIVSLPPSVETVSGVGPDGQSTRRQQELARLLARTLLRWVDQEEPDLLVVDGCPRLAGLAHLSGVPTVGVRSLGASWPTWGSDRPLRTVAPYPEELELPGVPAAVRRHTTFVGGYSSLDGRGGGRDGALEELGLPADRPVVAVVTGGGLAVEAERHLLAAAAATRGWRWVVTGAFTSTHGVVPDNLHPLGWQTDPHAALAAADVVVSSGDHATTADVASVRRPHLVLQDPAATHEMLGAVAQVVRARLATVLPVWPAPETWAGLLRDVQRLDTAPQARFCDHGGGRRLATALDAWARGVTPVRPEAA
jgi:UDP-N-acetylglucosamine--N-acetylmuramyl-(pentapeptide) pyrophosphoryl-undecaprenol N-acetylglucosamine transferase